ncbi:unnamed protein product, partial [marine sediment metagenome]
PTAIVHVANILVRGIGFGFAGDGLVPQIDLAAWQTLNISDSLLEEIIKEMDDKLQDAEEFLSGDGHFLRVRRVGSSSDDPSSCGTPEGVFP